MDIEHSTPEAATVNVRVDAANHPWRRSMALLGVGAVMGAGTFAGVKLWALPDLFHHTPPLDVHSGEDFVPSQKHAQVAKLKPIGFACRTFMESHISGSLHPTLLGSSLTGFEAKLEGMENLNTPHTPVPPYGVTDSLLCVTGFDAVASQQIKMAPQSTDQRITIDLSQLHPFTRINESETKVVTSLPALSAIGDGMAQTIKGLTGLASSVLTGEKHEVSIGLWTKWDDEMRGNVAQVLRQEEVNKVDTECVEQAQQQTEKVFTQSYYLQADQMHVPRNTLHINFIGKLSLNNTYPGAAAWNKQSHFKIDLNELQKNSPVCNVDPNVTADASNFQTIDPHQAKQAAQTIQDNVGNMFKHLP